MSGYSYEDVNVICPFYRRCGDLSLHCESPVEGAATITHFHNSADRKLHKKNFCDTFQYERCPIAGMLDAALEKKAQTDGEAAQKRDRLLAARARASRLLATRLRAARRLSVREIKTDI